MRNSNRKEAVRRIREGWEFRQGWIKDKLFALRRPVASRLDGATGGIAQNDEFLVGTAVARYTPKPYDGPVVLFQRSARPKGPYHDQQFGWGRLCKRLEIVELPGDHKDMFLDPTVRILAEKLASRLTKAQAPPIQG